MTSTIDRKIRAGNRQTLTWPVAVSTGTVAALDVVALVVNADTRAVITTVTPTITPDADPTTGTISADIPIPDATTARRIVVRLDGDDALGDLLADEVEFRIEPAIAQRPTP